MNATERKRLARFGPFEFDIDTGELREQGTRIQLQPKPQQILAALIENQGSLVTRDHLQQRLWNDGTFVDFEAGLNTAINRLRLKLGDSAEYPVYIETLSRSGYRFIAPVEFAPQAKPVQVPLAAPRAAEQIPPVARRGPSTRVIAAAVALAIGVLASAAVFAYRKPERERIHYRQLTYRRAMASSHFFSSAEP